MTLIGPGGTGKTRLSLRTGGEALSSFKDGVWLVELAPLSDPALIVQTVAAVFGLREAPDRPLVDLVVDYLRGKQLLLILDNCEHLIDACARLADQLLRNCPDLKILASSREALGIDGEMVYRVPSLSLPEQADLTLRRFWSANRSNSSWTAPRLPAQTSSLPIETLPHRPDLPPFGWHPPGP